MTFIQFNPTSNTKMTDHIKSETDGLGFLACLFQSNFPANMKFDEKDILIAYELIDAITEPYRDYFLYHEVLGFSYSEIAEQFDIDEETARRKVQEANVQLALLSRRYIIAALSVPPDMEHFRELSRKVYEKSLELIGKSWK